VAIRDSAVSFESHFGMDVNLLRLQIPCLSQSRKSLRRLSVLREDKRANFSAAAHAQRVADYLHTPQPKPGS
jgi:hypothetical protein